MADNAFIKVGLAGAAGYFLWKYFLQPAPAAQPVTAAAPNTAMSLPAPFTATAAQTLVRLNAAAPGQSLNADEWNWFLMNRAAPGPGFVAPDPLEVFGANLDRSKKMSASEYWAVMGPYLMQRGMGAYMGRRSQALAQVNGGVTPQFAARPAFHIKDFDEGDPDMRNGDRS